MASHEIEPEDHFEVSEQNKEKPYTETTSETLAINEIQENINRGLDRLTAKAEGVENAVNDVETIAPGKTLELKKRINQAWNRSIDAIKAMAIMTAIIYGPDMSSAPNYRVEKRVDSRGAIEYKHADRQTTLALDYLAGKAELPRDLRLKFVKKDIERIIRERNQKLPDNFHEFDETQTQKYIAEFYLASKNEVPAWEKEDHEYGRKIKDQRETWMDIFVTPKFNFSPKLYNALWEIEEQVGNPRVHFGEPFDKRDGSYRGPSNTIILDYPLHARNHGVFIAEAAHAEMSKNHPYSTSAKFVRDMIGVVYRSIREGKSLSEAQEDLYNIPGSYEHDAHSIIQPKLEEKLWPKNKK